MSWKSNAVLPLTGQGRRRALDGIRAVAVLAVLVGHAGPQWLPGGAAGVDVFFVLSGYLITEILLAQHRTPGALAAFWAGRARRLVPPLAVVIAATATAISLTAEQTADLWARWQHDLWFAAGYLLNWRLIDTGSDYDVLVHGQAPHVHLWSLAVEEQFYLIWPLVLAIPLVRIWPGRAVASLLAAALGALLLVATVADSPDRVLWGTDTRAVQLLAGAALAILMRKGPQWGKHWAQWCSGIGILLLVGLFAAPSPDSAWAAAGTSVVATIGAFALILGVDSGTPTAVGRLLAVRPLVALGIVSYAVYLWHLPVLWWWATATGQTGTAASVLVTLVGSVLLASFSWLIVESPLRGIRLQGTEKHPFRRPVILLGAAGAALVVTSGYVALALSPPATVLTRVDTASAFDCPEGSPVCQFQQSGRPDDWKCDRVPCPIYVPNQEPSAVVMLGGDSVARSLAPGLIEVAREQNWLLLGAAEGCSYIAEQRVRERADAPEEPDATTKECRGVADNLLAYARDNHVDLYIGLLGKPKAGLMINGETLLTGEPGYSEELAKSVRTGLDMLSGVADTVAIVSPPRPSWDAECVGDRDIAATGCVKNTNLVPYTQAERAALLEQPAHPWLILLDSDPILCPTGTEPCPPGDDGQVWRYDGIHLTLAGSRVLARALEPALVETIRQGRAAQ